MVLQTRVKQGSPQAGFEQPEFALPRAGSVLGITGSSGSRKGSQQLPTLICSLQQLNYSVEGVEQAHGTISALLTQSWWDPHGSKHL